MSRGIVIGQRIAAGHGSFQGQGAVQIQDVLRWLLYWDKITYAGVEFQGATIYGNTPQDVLFLENEGIFTTEFVDLQTLDQITQPTSTGMSFDDGIKIWGLTPIEFAVASAAARLELSKQLSESTGDIWSIGQAGGEQLLLPGTNKSKELIDVQLVNCLPVPEVGTSFEDILEFKHRYPGELDELRLAFDRLREKILSSSDERRVIDAAIRQIETAISDIRAALQGTGIQAMSETIALYIHNPALGFWTALGGAAAAAKGYPVEVGLAGGIAVPTVCRFLRRVIAGGQNLPGGNSDFAYVFEAIRKLDL